LKGRNLSFAFCERRGLLTAHQMNLADIANVDAEAGYAGDVWTALVGVEAKQALIEIEIAGRHRQCRSTEAAKFVARRRFYRAGL
jgi:hypothetical protein